MKIVYARIFCKENNFGTSSVNQASGNSLLMDLMILMGHYMVATYTIKNFIS